MGSYISPSASFNSIYKPFKSSELIRVDSARGVCIWYYKAYLDLNLLHELKKNHSFWIQLLILLNINAYFVLFMLCWEW